MFQNSQIRKIGTRRFKGTRRKIQKIPKIKKIQKIRNDSENKTVSDSVWQSRLLVSESGMTHWCLEARNKRCWYTLLADCCSHCERSSLNCRRCLLEIAYQRASNGRLKNKARVRCQYSSRRIDRRTYLDAHGALGRRGGCAGGLWRPVMAPHAFCTFFVHFLYIFCYILTMACDLTYNLLKFHFFSNSCLSLSLYLFTLLSLYNSSYRAHFKVSWEALGPKRVRMRRVGSRIGCVRPHKQWVWNESEMSQKRARKEPEKSQKRARKELEMSEKGVWTGISQC